MHRLGVAVSILVMLSLPTGCCNKTESGGEAPTPEVTPPAEPPAAATPTPAAPRFAGTYSSTWGKTVFEENGQSVTAKYPRGKLACLSNGDVLNCDWYEGSSSGKARLTLQSSGVISGTWGNGSSNSNGGPWVFTRTGEAAAPAAAGDATFEGKYQSTWGPTTFRQSGSSVTATYSRGRLACVVNGSTLNCDWYEGRSHGKARLTKQADGKITGTWGNGSSASNGGPWVFSPM